jgi:hypothetical protein
LGCITSAWSEDTTRTAQSTSCGIATGGEEAEGVAEVVGDLPSLVVTTASRTQSSRLTMGTVGTMLVARVASWNDVGVGEGAKGAEEDVTARLELAVVEFATSVSHSSELEARMEAVAAEVAGDLPQRSRSADVFASKVLLRESCC